MPGRRKFKPRSDDPTLFELRVEKPKPEQLLLLLLTDDDSKSVLAAAANHLFGRLGRLELSVLVIKAANEASVMQWLAERTLQGRVILVVDADHFVDGQLDVLERITQASSLSAVEGPYVFSWSSDWAEDASSGELAKREALRRLLRRRFGGRLVFKAKTRTSSGQVFGGAVRALAELISR